MRPAHVYEYLRRADGQRRPAQGSLLRVAFLGVEEEGGVEEGKKKRKKMTNAPRFNDLSAKKRGHRSWGHRNCLRWIAFVSEFFFFLTLDEEQNFACN